MVQEILEIIDNSEKPVYQLDAYISRLKTITELGLIWEDLKEIAMQGNLMQRFVVLTVISVNRPSYLESFSYELMGNRNFNEIELILKPIVSICSVFETEEHINYLLEVFEYAFRNNKDYLFEVVFRNIISSKYWLRIKNAIIEFISISDDITVIDMLAFFKSKRGDKEYQLLVNILPDKEQKRIINYQTEVNNRLKQNYEFTRK